MTDRVRISVEPEASAEDVQTVEAGLRAFNLARITLFGTLEEYPPGYRQYHLAKRFVDAPRSE
jgi:hypothetical protein